MNNNNNNANEHSIHSRLSVKSDKNEETNGTHFWKSTLEHKFLLWSILGLQGSLVSHFMSPVYLKTVIIRPHKVAAFMKETLQEKLNEVATDPTDSAISGNAKKPHSWPHSFGFHIAMPSVYGLRTSRRLKHPILSEEHSQLPPLSSGVCLNWIKELGVETVYCDTGATSHGKVSRLCKASLFDLFAGLSFGRAFPTLPWSTFRPVYPLNYGNVKTQAMHYRQTKNRALKLLKVDFPLNQAASDNFNAFDPK
jgi:hypothetical protein